MTINIIDGKKISQDILINLKKDIAKLSKKPKLIIIHANNDPSSDIYIKSKIKACEDVGIICDVVNINKSVSQKDLVNTIEKLNKDVEVSAIILQLPIWDHLDKDILLNTIFPFKDADGLTRYNLGKLFSDEDGVKPATARAVVKILENIEPKDKNVIIVGRSILVGKPLFHMLLSRDYTVTLCHSKTVDLKEHTKNADILISAVGKKEFITKDMVKKDSICIDVGISRGDNKIYGDISKDVYTIVKYITPVPGGVGPMTVACLLENVLMCHLSK